MEEQGLSLTLQISIILFFSLLGYIIAMRINQSAVIGVILIGIIVGPSVFGWVQYTEFVEALAHLGAIVLLFAIGFEFKLKEVYTKESTLIAIGGVAVSWILGYLLAMYVFHYDSPTSILIGTILVATSIAITAMVLLELGKLQTKTARTIMGAAVVDDVIGLILLSISVQMIHGAPDTLEIAIMAFKAIAFIVIGLFAAEYIRKFFMWVDGGRMAKKFPDFLFILAMTVAFGYSFAAELIGLSAIVGAFLAGSSLSGIQPNNSKDLKEGAEYIYIIFASIFFISLGILVDFHQVTQNAILFSVALIIVAVISKMIGCYLPARLLKESHKDSVIIGVGMIPRGEVGMIIGMIGLTAGVFTQDIYTAVIVMCIVTILIVPPMLKKFYK
ncbi:MAG: cation:proton antiporter [Candidatus Altiarchaeum hamiconexum]|uniref:Cation:proton antiporter n=1 Tax=Candidatus Altarchaeum hamiconexum TaxID=1803513 RepID=A0A8J7YVG8_9ARCH|nr:cation:proton antiporter [Candidatus Altarchaeum hamiconexum]OIQ06055.1 MAG: sodium:proton exchanger [Candidatus Altarchaeum sp. CG2_30_32_3053]PIN67595.1 MAG: sodium:proton exchanger [Candidatus Altarchaeum sp. CG12_big_fil_rev_8_21_14_0_65_33_22]PIV27655.1 MAG: cation:proton antiporter [Candidatus Altarchaeum sp. CG03_land_8_20_14_0_80_32_618]PIZ29598.1 MAG: cation:proton antiporter [Candidatus Altarchaeum sp. CG_4_10_14_0_8_um_filter_32_851]